LDAVTCEQPQSLMAVFARNSGDRDIHYESIFAFATLSIVVTDGNGVITTVNPFALKEFGYADQELTGKKIEVLIPPRYHEKHRHYHEEFIGKPRTRLMGSGLDLFAIKKSGAEFPVEISLSNYHKNGNKYVIAFISDITARKRTEKEITSLHEELEAKVAVRTLELEKTLEELQLANHRLEEALIFQKTLLDKAGAMIIYCNQEGIIKMINQEAAVKLGYEPAELTGRQSPAIFHKRSETARQRKELFDAFGVHIENDFDVFVEKARRDIHEEQQYTYIRKDGSTFPVSLTITAIKGRNGNINGFLGIAIDISQRIRAEEKLMSTLEKEKELGELKSRFVSMASHEFRTPLSTVLTSAYLIEQYTTTREQAKRKVHLQRIISSVNMQTDILNDFLSVGRIEEGKIQVRLSRFNIRELVNETARDMKNTLKEGQKIHYRHTGNEEVSLDPSLMKHIIMNLVSNAGKFSPERSLISIRSHYREDELVFSVKDHGIGISKEDQVHLMERFFRGANAGNIQGTGLGLHIVSKYAELMNGTVECNSELDKGTEFVITFNIKS